MRYLVICALFAAAGFSQSLIREEQTVVVDGVRETWRLQWSAPPVEECKPNELSLTCPCMGFAYGEAGDLFLVRLRGGAEIDRLRLATFFPDYPDKAVVQRWPVDLDRDLRDYDREDFGANIRKRPTVQVMHLADYDHDGEVLEFYLQTEAVPCGKSNGIVIGLSKQNRRLHVFGTVSNPKKPLYLLKPQWQALHDAKGRVEVLDWACYDHGAETETRLTFGIYSGWSEGYSP